MSNIIFIIFLELFITLIITLLFIPEEKEEKIVYKAKEKEDIAYLTLQNMTTDEILRFRNKNDFMRTIEGYETIKYFLKGTEEENIDKLINWYYKGYKKI